MGNQCSEEFAEAFRDGMNGCRRSCSCGREHFDAFNDWHGPLDEIIMLKQLALSCPDKYIAHEGAVGLIAIGGEYIVDGCVCNKALKYERFLIQHAPQIMKFLKNRARVLELQARAIKEA